MGCGSNKVNEDDNDDEINNYDERDNFYSFYPRIKRKNGKQSKDKEKDDKENSSKDEEKDKDEDKEENKSSEPSDKDKDKNQGDLDRNNTKSDNDNDNKDKDNSENKNDNKDNKNISNKNSDSQKNNKDKDRFGEKEKDKENKNITDSNPFKESDEIDYYKNKLQSKRDNKKKKLDTSDSKIMYDYKNLFSETGGKIPEYKVYAKNQKNEEKEKYWKKYKYNGVIIVEDLKEYFPKDISRDEIQELIFEAFGDNIVEDDDLIIPGQTASYDQVLELSDYVFNFIKGNEKKMKENRALKKLKVKVDIVPLDKKLINDKLFQGKDPSEKQLENTKKYISGNSKDVKVLAIEFL